MKTETNRRIEASSSSSSRSFQHLSSNICYIVSSREETRDGMPISMVYHLFLRMEFYTMNCRVVLHTEDSSCRVIQFLDLMADRWKNIENILIIIRIFSYEFLKQKWNKLLVIYNAINLQLLNFNFNKIKNNFLTSIRIYEKETRDNNA